MIDIVVILNQKADAIQRDLVLLHVGMLMTIMAYTAEIQATSIPVMKLCIKFAYVGKPIIIYSVFMLAADYCRVEINRYLKTLFGTIQMFIIGLVYTFDSHRLFYSKISYTEEGMFPHLVKGHGVLYNAYTAMLIFYGIATAVIYIQYIRRTQNKHEKQMCAMLIVIMMIPYIGFIIYLSGISGGYDCTITGYSIATFLFAIVFRKFDLFETVDLATDKIIRYLNAGIIVYDEFGSLLHINNMASRMKIIDKVEKLYESGEYFFFEDKVYRVEKFPVENDGVFYGYVYYIDNETNDYYYKKALKEEKQRADEADMAKARFLADVRHDIRIPVNSILGMSHLAEIHIDDKEKVKECLEKINASGNYFLEIVNETLNEMEKKESPAEIIDDDNNTNDN